MIIARWGLHGETTQTADSQGTSGGDGRLGSLMNGLFQQSHAPWFGNAQDWAPDDRSRDKARLRLSNTFRISAAQRKTANRQWDQIVAAENLEPAQSLSHVSHSLTLSDVEQGLSSGSNATANDLQQLQQQQFDLYVQLTISVEQAADHNVGQYVSMLKTSVLDGSQQSFEQATSSFLLFLEHHE